MFGNCAIPIRLFIHRFWHWTLDEVRLCPNGYTSHCRLYMIHQRLLKLCQAYILSWPRRSTGVDFSKLGIVLNLGPVMLILLLILKGDTFLSKVVHHRNALISHASEVWLISLQNNSMTFTMLSNVSMCYVRKHGPKQHVLAPSSAAASAWASLIQPS